MFLISIILAILLTTIFLRKLASTTKLQLMGDMVNHVPTSAKVIALTYDDGPNENHTFHLLNALQELKVKATFFLIGERIEDHPEVAQLVLEHGHELGNHSYSHRKMVLKSQSFIKDEIKKTDHLLRNLGIQKPIHFRSPFGYKRFRLPIVLASMKKKNILWNIDTHDYIHSDPQVAVDNIYHRIRPGSIILMHDQEGNGSPTIAITKQLVKRLRSEGYQFKTVSELLLM